MLPTTLPLLTTPRLRFRAPDDSDLPAWFDRARDPEIAYLSGAKPAQSIQEGADWLARVTALRQEGRRLLWSLDVTGGARSIGTVMLGLVEDTTGVATIGFVLGRAHWGQGYGGEAARAVMDLALGLPGLSAFRAEAVADNHASIRILKALGFRETGSFVDDFDGATMRSFARDSA